MRLDDWVAPAHLRAEARATYAERFKTSPARAVWLRDVLRPRPAAALHRFVREEAEFETGFGVFTRYGFVPEGVFRASAPDERFFRYGDLARPRAEAASGRGASTFRRLVRALDGEGFRGLFAEISGAPLGAVTVSARRMCAGDFLARHTDDVEGRVLSFVIYLSYGWSPSDGGALLLEGDGGSVERIEAEYNSLAVFDARTWHRVAPFGPTAGDRPRLSVSGWYAAPGAR